MEEKINNLVDTLKKFINENKKMVTVVVAAFLAVAAIIILVCTFTLGNKGVEETENDFGWGQGLTQGIPQFSQEAERIQQDEDFVAAYYSNVKSEDVAKYIELLTEECGVEFEGRQYPKTATLDDKIIAIHYNVTEMRFSVTVAKKN